jgi:hypothetical protein
MKAQLEPLTSWTALNEHVMSTEDESALAKLLDAEKKGRKRRMFIKRIHSRINKLRAARERIELEKIQ